MTKFVIKRNNSRVEFDSSKIREAIKKAFMSVYPVEAINELESKIDTATKESVAAIEKLDKDEISVEEIQNLVENSLMQIDPKVAKGYIIYRNKRTEIRMFKASLGIEDDELKLPINSLVVLSARYLLKDENGKIIETPSQLFHRVANAIASVEKKYNKSDSEVNETAQQFYDGMVSFKFMPNSPTLMNAGTKLGQLSACFVLPIEDSIEEIFDAIKNMAIIQKSGGGTGFSFSRLRPANDIVHGTSGVASGPISFLKIFNEATEQIKQGGKRRGANMGVLRVDHPDILDFIMAKENEGALRNFNLSIGITDKFMKSLENGKEYEIINPRTNKAVGKLNAKAVWNLLITMAWKTGDPGIIFLDRMNSTYSNPVPKYGPIESTNPCGEQPLYPYDSCNLASINLAKMTKTIDHHYEVDWDELERIVKLATRFLDDVIDANKFPIPEIEKVTKAIRRIGLGVMGWADLLIKLGIRYDSNEALLLAEKIMSFITNKAREESEILATERGPFPEFENSIWHNLGYKPLRNSTVTTIAPTGTISIIAGGASQGIEPIFSVVYTRNVKESLGSNLIEIDNEFERYSIDYNFYSEELMKKLAGRVSIQDVEEIPNEVKRLFVTAWDISPEAHVKMQAAFQKYTDNAVSKTINLPNYATPEDVEKAYFLAYKLGCKGITVYRDGSKKVQVLQSIDEHKQSSLEDVKNAHEKIDKVQISKIKEDAATYVLSPTAEKSCPVCGAKMIAAEGCFTCPRCGYSECS
ncbi:MAG: adenosylcobalamin-dependent ribonucleoside-diphosphate reductase [Candidatus Micrarchaeaceae archaeon]